MIRRPPRSTQGVSSAGQMCIRDRILCVVAHLGCHCTSPCSTGRFGLYWYLSYCSLLFGVVVVVVAVAPTEEEEEEEDEGGGGGEEAKELQNVRRRYCVKPALRSLTAFFPQSAAFTFDRTFVRQSRSRSFFRQFRLVDGPSELNRLAGRIRRFVISTG